jgi:hypothetical protein
LVISSTNALLLETLNRSVSKHDPFNELQCGVYCCCQPRGHCWIVGIDTFTFSELQNICLFGLFDSVDVQIVTYFRNKVELKQL